MVADASDDIFGSSADLDRDDGSEREREARITKEKHWNIGFKQAVFETRQAYIQPGFDMGFQVSALAAFCNTFIQESSPSEQAAEKAPCIESFSTGNGPLEHVPDSLYHAYSRIGVRFHDSWERRNNR